MQKKVFGPGETIIQQGIDWAAAVLAQSGMVLTLNDLSHTGEPGDHYYVLSKGECDCYVTPKGMVDTYIFQSLAFRL